MSKRVLHVVYSLEIGGLERVVVNLMNALDRTRYEPFVCCINRPGELAAHLPDPEKLFVLGNTGGFNCRSERRIFEILGSNGIDLVHSHNTAGLLYGYFPARLRRIPVVATVHGLDRDYDRRSLLNIVDRWMSRSVPCLVCVSGQLKDFLHRRYGIREERMRVIYNGVPVGGGAPRGGGGEREGIVIGSVGRLSAEKNYRLLIEAFAVIRKGHPGCSLTIVGGGGEYDALRRLCTSLDLDDAVTFTGPVTDVRRHIASFDIFSLTSLNEGISMSILEAMSYGTVCVVSAVGGNGEIIKHGENGFIFESGNREDLVAKLEEVIRGIDGAEMAGVRRRARETVGERFSVEAMVERYSELYDAVTC